MSSPRCLDASIKSLQDNTRQPKLAEQISKNIHAHPRMFPRYPRFHFLLNRAQLYKLYKLYELFAG